tara:strand:- start:822 stop:1280 length:459 start_codon:yes stop_codon:yes gene_type:complete
MGMDMRIAFLCVVAWPSVVAANSWHEFGECMYATQVAADGYDDQQGAVAVARGKCTKDVNNSDNSFVVTFSWLNGDRLRISAQNRRRSLEMFINNEPAVMTSAPILGFSDCYATSIKNGFKHYCFKGNGLVFEGVSPPISKIPKDWELSRDW